MSLDAVTLEIMRRYLDLERRLEAGEEIRMQDIRSLRERIRKHRIARRITP